MWDKALEEATIFILDPSPIIESHLEKHERTSKQEGREVAEIKLERDVKLGFAALDPHIWLRHFPIAGDGITWDQGSSTAEIEKMISELSQDNLVNVRRRCLKSQSIHEEFLHLHDTFLLGRSAGKDIIAIPPDQVVLNLASGAVFDEGHSSDIEVLQGYRSDTNSERLGEYHKLFALPRRIPGNLRVQSSETDFRIQLADVAAGEARKLYLAKRTRDALRSKFKRVYINGSLWAGAPAPPRPMYEFHRGSGRGWKQIDFIDGKPFSVT